MAYFSYHGTAKRLIRQGRLTGYYYVRRYRHIAPALVLVFDDIRHPVMPIRQHRWEEYRPLLPPFKRIRPPKGEAPDSFT